MIFLSPLRLRRRLLNVSARRSRFALLGALLAFVAIVGLSAVSGWHSAAAHHDEAVHSVSIAVADVRPQQPAPESPLHVEAHATSHLLALEEQLAPAVFSRLLPPGWVDLRSPMLAGREPAELLRPPRG